MNTFLQFYSPTYPLSMENYGQEPYSEWEGSVVKDAEESNESSYDILRPDLNQHQIEVLADKISDKLVEIVQQQLTTG